MNEETMSGCITHKDTRHIRLYYDYLDIYKNNEHKAKIIRVLETWTDTKRAAWYKEAVEQKEQGNTPPEPDFWITMSFQQFRHFMRETISIDTIKVNLAELIKMKHIERRVNPDNPYGSPQYKINCAVIQKTINKLASPAFIPEVPDLSEEETPQEVTPPPGKVTPPPGVDLPPTQGGEIPLPRGGNTPLPQGGKTATSNITITKITTNNTHHTELVPPHVGTAGAHSLFEEEEPQPTAPPNVPAGGKKPATGKRKSVRDLSAIAPVPPPEKPEPVSPFTVQVCLALADHYRGYVLTNGSYGMMQNEAIAIVRRGITYERLDRVYRYMKGLDKKEDGTGLYDEYWEDKTFDLLHVNKHLEAKEKEIRKKILQQRSAGKQREAPTGAHVPPRMPSDAELRKQVY